MAPSTRHTRHTRTSDDSPLAPGLPPPARRRRANPPKNDEQRDGDQEAVMASVEQDAQSRQRTPTAASASHMQSFIDPQLIDPQLQATPTPATRDFQHSPFHSPAAFTQTRGTDDDNGESTEHNRDLGYTTPEHVQDMDSYSEGADEYDEEEEPMDAMNEINDEQFEDPTDSQSERADDDAEFEAFGEPVDSQSERGDDDDDELEEPMDVHSERADDDDDKSEEQMNEIDDTPIAGPSQDGHNHDQYAMPDPSYFEIVEQSTVAMAQVGSPQSPSLTLAEVETEIVQQSWAVEEHVETPSTLSLAQADRITRSAKPEIDVEVVQPLTSESSRKRKQPADESEAHQSARPQKRRLPSGNSGMAYSPQKPSPKTGVVNRRQIREKGRTRLIPRPRRVARKPLDDILDTFVLSDVSDDEPTVYGKPATPDHNEALWKSKLRALKVAQKELDEVGGPDVNYLKQEVLKTFPGLASDSRILSPQSICFFKRSARTEHLEIDNVYNAEALYLAAVWQKNNPTKKLHATQMRKLLRTLEREQSDDATSSVLNSTTHSNSVTDNINSAAQITGGQSTLRPTRAYAATRKSRFPSAVADSQFALTRASNSFQINKPREFTPERARNSSTSVDIQGSSSDELQENMDRPAYGNSLLSSEVSNLPYNPHQTPRKVSQQTEVEEPNKWSVMGSMKKAFTAPFKFFGNRAENSSSPVKTNPSNTNEVDKSDTVEKRTSASDEMEKFTFEHPKKLPLVAPGPPPARPRRLMPKSQTPRPVKSLMSTLSTPAKHASENEDEAYVPLTPFGRNLPASVIKPQTEPRLRMPGSFDIESPKKKVALHKRPFGRTLGDIDTFEKQKSAARQLSRAAREDEDEELNHSKGKTFRAPEPLDDSSDDETNETMNDVSNDVDDADDDSDGSSIEEIEWNKVGAQQSYKPINSPQVDEPISSTSNYRSTLSTVNRVFESVENQINPGQVYTVHPGNQLLPQPTPEYLLYRWLNLCNPMQYYYPSWHKRKRKFRSADPKEWSDDTMPLSPNQIANWKHWMPDVELTPALFMKHTSPNERYAFYNHELLQSFYPHLVFTDPTESSKGSSSAGEEAVYSGTPQGKEQLQSFESDQSQGSDRPRVGDSLSHPPVVETTSNDVGPTVTDDSEPVEDMQAFFDTARAKERAEKGESGVLQPKPWAQTPPPKPRPSNAQLPQQQLAEITKASVNKWAPKQPSKLREVTHMSPSPTQAQKVLEHHSKLFPEEIVAAARKFVEKYNLVTEIPGDWQRPMGNSQFNDVAARAADAVINDENA